MSQRFRRFSVLVMAFFIVFCGLTTPVMAGKLAIVIDDFGYRPHNEKQILALPAPITVSVLPDAPYARQMAVRAHELGHEVLIHMPMAPLSKQPLEKDTLFPDMRLEEIRRIIHNAEHKVPYAVGMNNHMGSAMTSNLSGMRKVMQVLSGQNLFFLDSRTVSNSQVTTAAAGTGVPVLQRDVFLDDSQQDAAIRKQFERAVSLARRKGSAIAIGHPHPATVRVLQQVLKQLPVDIKLVAVSQLLNDNAKPAPAEQWRPGVCPIAQPLPPVPVSRFFTLLWQAINDSWQNLKKI